MSLKAINPATGNIIRTYPEMSSQEVEAILTASNIAFQNWRQTSFTERTRLMKQVAKNLLANRDEYARLMATEMGKPITGGRAEIEKCAWVCEYYGENAEAFLKPEYITTNAQKSMVCYQPIGVVLGIMPWNFPFWQVFRYAVPTLMAGNTSVLKHASNVPGCALAIEKIFTQSGFPENVFRSLMIGSAQVEAVIANQHVRAVTLTGSTAAGKAVATKAASEIKKTVLELGGSDPYIILADADLNLAVPICVASRLNNTGQSCIAAKRFIVVESQRCEFEKLMLQQMQKVAIGDPLSEVTVVGPMARKDLRDQLHKQVQDSIAQGAHCILGGKMPPQAGLYYPPTILTNVKKGMPAYEEELFGPVATIIAVKDESEAIRVANDTEYGLGAAVFTSDVAKGEKIAADKLEAGFCAVNGMVKSDPRLPFGGVKQSGYGRELSHVGIKEFVNIKTVCVH